MEFKIYQETVVTKTNIFGQPIESKTTCYIYRPICFGLFKLFLYFKEDWDIRNRDNNWWEVCYKPYDYATKFSEQEAEKMLKTMYEQPNKFIRKYD